MSIAANRTAVAARCRWRNVAFVTLPGAGGAAPLPRVVLRGDEERARDSLCSRSSAVSHDRKLCR